MPHSADWLFAFGDMSHLHSLAERVHNVADELPLTDTKHSGSDNLDELGECVRAIASLLTHLVTAAAFADRSVQRNSGQRADVTRGTVAGLTRAAGALGGALADLGDAVAHAGLLHQLDSLPRSPERRSAARSARAALDDRLDRTRRHLNEAGRQLHGDADRLMSPPSPLRASQAPSAAIAPRPAMPAPPPRTRAR